MEKKIFDMLCYINAQKKDVTYGGIPLALPLASFPAYALPPANDCVDDRYHIQRKPSLLLTLPASSFESHVEA